VLYKALQDHWLTFLSELEHRQRNGGHNHYGLHDSPADHYFDSSTGVTKLLPEL